MKKTALALTFLLGAVSAVFAQNDKTLFWYGNHDVSLNEFERVFFKNNNPDKVTADTAKDYLNLFINFKLKVQDAKDHGMDTSSSFREELDGYRRQLAQPYMQDKEVTEGIIDEAYRHKQEEVRASHILIKVAPYALPKDTIEAYNKIIGIRNRILKGENFDTLAVRYSEDPSAPFNYGDLGYFTAFDMIYPFERAAFNAKPGDLTAPVRTQVGYHILKVVDRRPARGEMHVAHLMIRVDAQPTDEQVKRGKEKADSILVLIKSGKLSFEDAVKSYTDDYSSKNKSGDLGWVKSTERQYPIDFREAAFALKNNGDISSAPVHTKFGWHILKRIEHKPVPAKTEIYDQLKNDIFTFKDERSMANKKAVTDRILKEYKFESYPKNLEEMLVRADSSIMNGSWKTEKFTGKKPLFKLGEKTYTQADFSNYLETYQTKQPTATPRGLMDKMYKDWVDAEAWDYEERNLPNKFEKYRYLLQEYHEGILLFNHTQAVIYDKALSDTSGQKAFYEANKSRYQWKERLDVSIYECNDEATMKAVQKMLKKGKADTTIINEIHQKNKLGLNVRYGKYQRGDNKYVDAAAWNKKGLQTLGGVDGKYIIIDVKNILPPGPKAFNETKGPVIADFQNDLEKSWIQTLKAKYPVKMNDEVWNAFLAKLKK